MALAMEEKPTKWYSPSRAASQAGGGSDVVSEISLRLRQTTGVGQLGSEDDTVPGHSHSDDPRTDQRMLWVDGVGGYLVSTSDDLSIGLPAAPGAVGPDIAILADLSRRHARLARQDGRYVLTPYSDTTVDGRAIEGPTILEDGAEIGLGSPDQAGGVRLRLRRPHALSASALLTIESGHRTAPAADAVLLMAESCVLGPKPHSHLRAEGWQDEVILFRGAEGLQCRSTGELLLDGQPAPEPVVVLPGRRIEGQDFAFSLEEVAGA